MMRTLYKIYNPFMNCLPVLWLKYVNINSKVMKMSILCDFVCETEIVPMGIRVR
jgi:hypothetical protein